MEVYSITNVVFETCFCFKTPQFRFHSFHFFEWRMSLTIPAFSTFYFYLANTNQSRIPLQRGIDKDSSIKKKNPQK